MLVSDLPALVPMDSIGPAIGAVVFVAIMSLVPEPARRSFNAIFAAGAIGVYIGGSFGTWELLYPVLATPIVYLGLRSYKYIGIAWLMHAAWGFTSPPMGQANLAFHAKLVFRLHDLRFFDRDLVPCWCSFSLACVGIVGLYEVGKRT
jgi:hypothetical protein